MSFNGRRCSIHLSFLVLGSNEIDLDRVSMPIEVLSKGGFSNISEVLGSSNSSVACLDILL